MQTFLTPLRLRSETAHRVTWLELFFDLVFVAAVAQVAEPLREHYAWSEVARFAPLFVLIWWAWTGHALFSTRFDTDDAAHRVLTLLQMFVVAVMAANAKDALDGRSSAGFAAAYAAMRFVLVAQYWRARRVPEARALATGFFAGHGLAALVWLASALVPAPARFWCWGAAFLIDLGTPWVVVRHSVAVPPSAHHLPERVGLFTLILLGDAVVAVMQGMESQETWTPGAAASAFLGMAILVVIWSWYFDGLSGGTAQPVRTRRDAVRFHIWSYSHLPFYLGVAVAGAGIYHIVAAASHMPLAPAEGLILTAAVATAMGALTVIGMTSAGRRRERPTRWVPHAIAAAVTLAIGATGHPVSPVVLVVALTALCLVQLGVSLFPRPAAVRPLREASA